MKRVVQHITPRLRPSDGFIMIICMGVLMVTMLLSAAVFLAVQSDTSLTRGDLDGKRAYAAAQSGMQAYLYSLNVNASNSTWWETCTNDMSNNGAGTAVAVPGSTTAATYSYLPVPANAATACSTTDPVGSLIDTGTGTLRMAFTGYSGHATRSIVASFRTLSPLSFLWYTVYETEDTSITGANSGCDRFYYQSPGPPSSCDIFWVSGDHMNGPMYTQDQFLISPSNAPTFGRAGTQDAIVSQVPTNGANDIYASSQPYGATATNAEPNPTNQVDLPADNSNLANDAAKHGVVFTGTTTLHVSGSTAVGYNCPDTTQTNCTPVSVDLTAKPIIYSQNGSGCNTTYAPTSVTYHTFSMTPPSGSTGYGTTAYYGACGDVYIDGSYSAPLTIAAANDVVVTGNLTNATDTTPGGTASPTGSATLGLVADEYVRVMHDGLVNGNCPSGVGSPNVTIDGAILTLQHSFFVDNYQCGGLPQGSLTIHGALAQYFRGIVGSVGASGYLKNYNYDDRLSLILPPYLFDLQNTQWAVFRETLCKNVSSSNPASCGTS
jgi:Tfp pilus assembly protein PilX